MSLNTDFGIYAALVILGSIFTAIFWMVVGWRAMRAHEKIADCLSTDLHEKAMLARLSQRSERRNQE